MLVKAFVVMMLAGGVAGWVWAEATNVPAIQDCEGGEVGYPAAMVQGDVITFYLATEQMPFQGWEPVICSMTTGQMMQAMQSAREM